MLDYPQANQQPHVVEEHLMADATSTPRSLFQFSFGSSPENADPYYNQARSIVASLDDGFSSQSIYDVFYKTYEFIKREQGLSLAQQREDLIKIIDYIIDITDSPFLPDAISDPIFKTLAPTLIDLFLSIHGPDAGLIPVISDMEPTPQNFQTFIGTLKATYEDGFQLSDIAIYVTKTTAFIMGFSLLSQQEKIEAASLIVESIIDNVNFGPFPAAFTAPILKSFTKPLITYAFSQI